jgi:uncharacterized protein
VDYPTYDPKSNNSPLAEDELATLDELLQSLPVDGAMPLDGLDGYLTGLLVGPAPLPPTAAWLPAVWGGDPEPGGPAPFQSNQKKKRTTVLVLRHLRAIAAQLESDPANWEPVFNVAAAPGDDGEELADAGDWCLGFLAATDLAPEAWAPLFADAEVGPGLATIALLAGEGENQDGEAPEEVSDEEDLEDPQVRDSLSRAAAEVVPLLWARKTAAAA